MRSVTFRDFTQCRLVFCYRNFGKTYLSHLEGSKSPRRASWNVWSLKIKQSKRLFFLDYLTLGDGTESLCWNAGNTLRTYAGEPTVLGWLKVRCFAEVPELDEHLSLLSIYGYRLAIGYFGVVIGGVVSCTRFLGGFRGWGLVLAVWTPLR